MVHYYIKHLTHSYLHYVDYLLVYQKKQVVVTFFLSSRRRHTSWPRDWSSDVCSSDLTGWRLTSGVSPLSWGLSCARACSRVSLVRPPRRLRGSSRPERCSRAVRVSVRDSDFGSGFEVGSVAWVSSLSSAGKISIWPLGAFLILTLRFETASVRNLLNLL